MQSLERGEKVRFPLFVVNAFIAEDCDGLSSGNPAAVVLIAPEYNDLEVGDEWMQQVAAVMNLSETVFVRWNSGSTREYEIRWFTPKAEVDLCGHATVAAAVALEEHGPLSEPLRFRTKNGDELNVSPSGDYVSLYFPADPPSQVPDTDSYNHGLVSSVSRALGISGKKKQGTAKLLRGKYDLVVQLPSADDVRSLEVDFELLKKVPTDRGIAVCAAGDGEGEDFAFVGRFFAPKVGINEDPVTGSMMCTLAPLFLEEGGKLKKVRQLSQRGGALQVRMARKTSVVIRGRAKIIVTGHIDY